MVGQHSSWLCDSDTCWETEGVKTKRERTERLLSSVMKKKKQTKMSETIWSQSLTNSGEEVFFPLLLKKCVLVCVCV